MKEGESRTMQPLGDQCDVPGGPVPVPPRDNLDTVAVAGQGLLQLLDRIEEFATQQFRRLEMMIDLLENSSGKDASLQEKQVEKWKQQWEKERSAERRRLQEEGQLLIRAWKELENEQRRLLGMRESIAVHRAVPCESAREGPRPAEEVKGVEEMALSQFQKLRREIQHHARRGKTI
jgi:hypothetical protein